MTDLSPPVLYPSDRVIPISTVPQCYTVTDPSPPVLYPSVVQVQTRPHHYSTPVLHGDGPVPASAVSQCYTFTDVSPPLQYPSVIQWQTCPHQSRTQMLHSDSLLSICIVVVFTFFTFLLTFHANSILTPRSIFDSPPFQQYPDNQASTFHRLGLLMLTTL